LDQKRSHNNRKVPERPFFQAAKNHPEVIAHRGGAAQWPAETIYAFQQATQVGVDVLEMDVRRTLDNQLVLMHNRTVDETTNGSGAVRKFSLAEITKLNAAAGWPLQANNVNVPSLNDVGIFVQSLPQMRLNIEIKERSVEAATLLGQFIKSFGLEDRVLVASAWPSVLNTFRTSFPKVATSASVPEIWTFELLNLFLIGKYRPNTDAIQWHSRFGPIKIITRRFVEQARKQGLKVHAWTVNEPAEMERMMKLGIDGIITDYPSTLLHLCKRLSGSSPRSSS
jgi:glycerophosphoryl diester phosphodiesterase